MTGGDAGPHRRQKPLASRRKVARFKTCFGFRAVGDRLTRRRPVPPYLQGWAALRRSRQPKRSNWLPTRWRRHKQSGRQYQNTMVRLKRPPPIYIEPRRPRKEMPWWLLSKAELYALHREAGTLDIFFDLFPEPG